MGIVKDALARYRLSSQRQQAAEFCMRCAGQTVREVPSRPTDDELLLRAKLIIEEALETCRALGVLIRDFTDAEVDLDDLNFEVGLPFDLLEAIDGCIDLNVVVAGTLSCVGVPDQPFQDEVDKANCRKFPGGEAIIDPDTGKYLKPPGWQPPNHQAVLNEFLRVMESV